MGEDGVREGMSLLASMSATLTDLWCDFHAFPWEKQRFNSSLITSKLIISGVLSFYDHFIR